MGQPHWQLLPLKMLSTCTCYSRFHWRWFRSCVTLLLDNVAISCSCTFLDLNGTRVGSLLFLMSVFYWHTCRVADGSRVTSSLDHVSYFYWSTWPFIIRPCVKVLSVYVLFFIRPPGLMTSFHMLDFY